MITQATPQNFIKAIKIGEVEIIDVRTHSEFIQEHIEGAKNLDICSPIFGLNAHTIQKHKVLAVYCRNGHISQTAAEEFEKMGFTRIIHLYGGLISWKMSQLPLVHGS